MKKIFLSAFTLLLIVAANAQNERSAPVPKTNTEPLVNGMPYSQYKAEQDALKQKSAAKPVTPQTAKGNNSMNDGYVPPAKTTEPVVTKKEEAVAMPAIDLSSSSVRQLPANAGSIPSAGDAGKNVLPGMVNGSMPVAEEAKPASNKPMQTKAQTPAKEEAVTSNQATLPAGVKVEAAPVSTESQKAVEKPASNEPTGNSPKPVKSKTE